MQSAKQKNTPALHIRMMLAVGQHGESLLLEGTELNTVLHCKDNSENSKQIFPEKELCGLSPNFYIHVSVSDLYIPTIELPILLQENR
jgi:hypothetical protein